MIMIMREEEKRGEIIHQNFVLIVILIAVLIVVVLFLWTGSGVKGSGTLRGLSQQQFEDPAVQTSFKEGVGKSSKSLCLFPFVSLSLFWLLVG